MSIIEMLTTVASLLLLTGVAGVFFWMLGTLLLTLVGVVVEAVVLVLMLPWALVGLWRLRNAEPEDEGDDDAGAD